MKVSKKFKSEIRSRVINEWVGSVIAIFVGIFGVYPMMTIQISESNFPETVQLILFCFLSIWIGWCMFLITRPIFRLRRIIIEKVETEDSIDLVFYSGKTMTLDKRRFSVKKYDWKVSDQYTHGRVFEKGLRWYFSPDSEFDFSEEI